MNISPRYLRHKDVIFKDGCPHLVMDVLVGVSGQVRIKMDSRPELPAELGYDHYTQYMDAEHIVWCVGMTEPELAMRALCYE